MNIWTLNSRCKLFKNKFKSLELLYILKLDIIQMQGTCQVCGANNVDLQEKQNQDGQTQKVCNQCA